MSARRQARAFLALNGSVTLMFPWVDPITPGLVERLKMTIPPHAREYDPQSKCWTIGEAYAGQAIHLLRAAFPDARVVDTGEYARRDPPPRQALAGERHYAALCLLPTAPQEVVNAAYRAWCKLSHPDALPHGERDRAHQRMVEVNVAYEALRAEGLA